MQNAKTYDDIKEREETTSRILTSISSYIIQLTNDGLLDWCNQEAELERILSTPAAEMRTTHFSKWLDNAVSDTDWPRHRQPELARRVQECLQSGKRFSSKTTNANGVVTESSVRVHAKGHEDDESRTRFFTYALTPMFHKNMIDERATEEQVGDLS